MLARCVQVSISDKYFVNNLSGSVWSAGGQTQAKEYTSIIKTLAMFWKSDKAQACREMLKNEPA